MDAFTVHRGRVCVIDRPNIDTDQIIPKQFLKSIERTGFGQWLFYDWRYDAAGAPRADFELNQPQAQGATILVAGENFGCGSSREHAAWALRDFGLRAVIAPSFADIFLGNALQTGLLPVILPSATVRELVLLSRRQAQLTLEIDLAAQSVTSGDGRVWTFSIDPQRKQNLLAGLDEIGLTLQMEAQIREYERVRSV
ncbi:MAG: 3-isopropylmalate dehydratase small subunit [Firmicutes bacterium]|nr:3-isopropylmalate dehydratase small subunit [Bacillota bacterium]